jgi:hypothetical protein
LVSSSLVLHISDCRFVMEEKWWIGVGVEFI